MNPFTPIEQFGRDHWSLLGFIEVLCVDHRGELSDKHRRNLRININTHPLMGYWPMGEPLPWRATSDTRLKDGSQIPNHDDVECIDDLIEAKLITNSGTRMTPIFGMTPFGSKAAGALRAFKANGGSFGNFTYDKIPA